MWAPLNLVFVAMNVTGFFALQSVGAGEWGRAGDWGRAGEWGRAGQW